MVQFTMVNGADSNGVLRHIRTTFRQHVKMVCFNVRLAVRSHKLVILAARNLAPELRSESCDGDYSWISVVRGHCAHTSYRLLWSLPSSVEALYEGLKPMSLQSLRFCFD